MIPFGVACRRFRLSEFFEHHPVEGPPPASASPLARTSKTDALARLATHLLAPVDAPSLVAFRVGFGLILAGWAADYLWFSRRLYEFYGTSPFHFTYYPLDFVRPWGGAGMTIHFGVLLILALCIAAGLWYRLSTTLFAVGFAYFFLLDRTNYQNHYYLLLLLSVWLPLLPLHRCAALDARFGLVASSSTVPAWALWIVRFHIALPYVFGGVAKLHSDWLAGEPMRTHLLSGTWPPLLQPLLRSELTIGVLTWGGMLFDFAVVPLLLWRPTRLTAYVLCVGFHLANSFLFHIHVFPWFMIFATTVFFDPGWPRRLFGLLPLKAGPADARDWNSLTRRPRLAGALLGVYVLIHLALPFRHLLAEGDSNWTERGHHFSWRMMLRSKESALRFYLTDSATGVTRTADLRTFVNLEQLSKAARDPEMILHLAHHLADTFRRETGRRVEVHALVLCSLNGRKPQLLIDPNIDLAREPRGFHQRPWIMPLREPLRRTPWSVPLLRWEMYVDIPPLKFLDRDRTMEAEPTITASPG